jgi:quercetin dioxygenase-like cupin family protein
VRVIDFVAEPGRQITTFGSQGLSGVGLIRAGSVGVTVLRLEAGGQIGRHPAPVDQLFVMVAGSGSVSGDTGEWRPIGVGQAAYWTAGEQHATRAEESLTAIVIEMPGLMLTR